MPATTPSERTATSRDEHPARRNIQAIAQLEQQALENRSAADRLSDAITRVTGSILFAVAQASVIILWLLVNTGRVNAFAPFDPYPFSLLTLFVSLETIFLSVFVLMSQNRMARQADRRAHLDLQVNLLAERELTAVLAMQRAICLKLGISLAATDEEVRQLLKETDVHELASVLEEELPAAPGSTSEDDAR